MENVYIMENQKKVKEILILQTFNFFLFTKMYRLTIMVCSGPKQIE